MRIEIDQSGKIENTNRKTVVAFSNSRSGAIVILSKDKKIIQKYFRSIKKPRVFIYVTFVALIYLLVKNVVSAHDQIIIDREYPGYEKLIVKSIKNLLNVDGLSIDIAQIDRKSSAHDLAWKELQSRIQKRARKVTCNEVIRVIKKSGSI